MIDRAAMLRRYATVMLTVCAIGLSSGLAQTPHTLTTADQQRIDAIVRKMTLAEKLDYIGGTGSAIRAMPAFHLPAFEMSDGPIGVRSSEGLPSTTYAAGIGLAASWDRSLAVRVGAGIGRDARARGVSYMLGPGVNIYRSPRNGRNFEYFGEDPFLTSNIAVGYITGMQQQGVSATIKHFIGNNSEFLRHDSDSVIEERALRELYLPSFEAAVKQAHVGAIMDSYNLIDGEHATQNSRLNIDILRREYGFQGTLMSDWDATYSAMGAANGGLDLEMPTGKVMNRANLEPAIKAGAVAEAAINEKVRHILATALSLGWLDRPQTDASISYTDRENATVALDSARESAVLLKNKGALLPLDRTKVKSILIVGPGAYPGVPVGGGSAGVAPFHTISPLEGLMHAVDTSTTVFYERGLPTVSVLARGTQFMTAKTNGRPGLTVETFHNANLSGKPALTNQIEHVDFAGVNSEIFVEDPEAAMALSRSGAKHLSRRLTGFYRAASSGKYILALQGAGESSGNRVFIDGARVIDDWELVRAFQPHITLELAAGMHKVVVEDRQNGPLGGRLRFGIVAADTIVNDRARDLAGKADVVLVAAGFDADSESEGADRTFALPFGQDELIRAMAAANKKTIVTLNSGGGIDMTAWLERVPVLLQTWYAGQDGGRVLAEILFGEVNPSGHLPITMEERAEDSPTFHHYYPEPETKRVIYKEGVFVGYRGYEHNHVKPLFPFGYGLSYTTFKFANLAVNPQSAGANPRVNVTFDVTNTGSRAGAEVAQVYVSEDHPKVARPERELKGFERVELTPGQTKHVSVALNARSFAYYSVEAEKWTIDPGKFTVHVGESVESTPLQGGVELTREAAASTF